MSPPPHSTPCTDVLHIAVDGIAVRAGLHAITEVFLRLFQAFRGKLVHDFRV